MERSKPLKWYKSLDSVKSRVDARAFLVEGTRAIKQLIDHHPDKIIEILVTEKLASQYSGPNLRILTEQQIDSISSTKTPQGVIAVAKLPMETYSDSLPANPGASILLLEDIQDPGNAGTLIRTASAFDFSTVIMSEKCADPFSPKCVQSTAGSILSINIRRSNNYLKFAQQLKDQGFRIVASDLKGSENPGILGKSARTLLALGNEASGLTKSVLALSDHLLKIPINENNAESLNVASCGAILMYLARSSN
jgi:RNA methyltransferase, TrmH family